MWSFLQIPELYLNVEPVSFWNKFGIPAVQAQFFVADTYFTGVAELGTVAAVVLVAQSRRGEALMFSYILRRVLLMVPTLIGVLTGSTFVVMQFVPGGPVEQVMAEARAGAIEGRYKAGRDLDKQRVEELKKLYGFDKPAHVRYFEMLGVVRPLRPRSQLHAEQGRLAADQGEAAGLDLARDVDVPG